MVALFCGSCWLAEQADIDTIVEMTKIFASLVRMVCARL